MGLVRKVVSIWLKHQKVILSTAVVEALEPITEKQKKVSSFREATMNSIVQFGADEFQTSKRMR